MSAVTEQRVAPGSDTRRDAYSEPDAQSDPDAQSEPDAHSGPDALRDEGFAETDRDPEADRGDEAAELRREAQADGADAASADAASADAASADAASADAASTEDASTEDASTGDAARDDDVRDTATTRADRTGAASRADEAEAATTRDEGDGHTPGRTAARGTEETAGDDADDDGSTAGVPGSDGSAAAGSAGDTAADGSAAAGSLADGSPADGSPADGSPADESTADEPTTDAADAGDAADPGDADAGDAADPGDEADAARHDDDPVHAATARIDPSRGFPPAVGDEDDPVDRLEVVGSAARTGGIDVVQDARSASPGQLRVDFGAHLEANYQRLVAQLYAITLEPGEAHDVVQDAYSRAWRDWDEISRTPDPSAWIRRVAVRSTIRSWRRVLARFGNGRPVAIGDGVDERTAALLAALGRLQPAERRAVVLFHMAGSSLSEIAAVERVRPATVRARLSRARHVVAEGMADVLPEVLGTDSAPRPPAGYPDPYISGYLYTSYSDGTSP